MKLWLDDVRDPADYLSDGYDWYWVKTVTQALELIEEWKRRGVEWTDASLDHDLGAFDTGYDLLNWMAETNNWPTNAPMVHSMNPVGRKRMQDFITRHYQMEDEDE